MDHSKQLGEEKIFTLLLRFSIPAIIGMLVNALYNLVDGIFVGRGVGNLALAGTSVTLPVMLVMMAFMMLIGIGATAQISINLGQKNKEAAEQILGNAFTLIFIVSAILTISGLIFLEPLLKLLSADAASLPYAKAYLQIILMGTVFQAIGFGLNNIIRAEGNPRLAMITMLIGAILNSILNPIFIFIFHWGIRGSAIATVISQLISAIWILVYFSGNKSTLKIRAKYMKLKFSIVKRIAAIGFAPFALQVAAGGVSILFNKNLMIYGGNIEIAAMGAVNRVLMLIMMPIFGINQGVQPIIGYNYGAQNYNRVKEALKLAILFATTLVIAGFAMVMLFAEQLIGIFNSDPQLIAFGSHGMRAFLIFLPLIGFQIVGANYFQAVGKPSKAAFLSLSRQVLILTPALLLLPRFFQINGILAAGPVSDLLSSVITAAFLYIELKHLGEKHEETLAYRLQTEE